MSNLVPCLDENGVPIEYNHEGRRLKLFYDKKNKSSISVTLGVNQQPPLTILEEEKIDDQTPAGMDALNNDEPLITPMEEEEMKGLGDDQSSQPLSATARMPVDKDAKDYNMNHPRRGKAVVFINDKFDNETIAYRGGSDVDEKNILATFEDLGFETKLHKNLKANEIEETIKELSKENHSEADCVCIIVLTHGLTDNYVHAKDYAYSIDRLWEPFLGCNCPTLAGKPKWFIIQACRGEKLDGGIKLERPSSEPDGSQTSLFYTIPNAADFLFAFSTFRGFYSWRNPNEGSFFIRSLCKELKANAGQVHLLDLLTDVARDVALHHETFHDTKPHYDKKRQVPNLSSTLLRKIHLRPKCLSDDKSADSPES